MQPSICSFQHLRAAPSAAGSAHLSWDRTRITQNPYSTCGQVNPNHISLHRPPLPFMSCWKMKYFPLCFVSFIWFSLTHVLMSQMTGGVSAICSHGNDSCTHAQLLNSSAYIIWELSEHYPNTAHLSILLKVNEPFSSCSRHITHPWLIRR